MWADIGGFDPFAIRREAVAYRRWVSQRLGTRRFLGWIVESGQGQVAGSGCVWVVESLPRPGDPQRWRPYVLSMYTDPEFRGRGVASSIVRAAVAWSRARGFSRITLHGSEMGRPVYARLGFERTWEMRRQLIRAPTSRKSRARA
jgi:GNAT superfamily N-acetyltransferase